MDHILLWGAIAFVVLILGVIWRWLRKLQHRSRRRIGNNYLYQEYNYDYNTDFQAIDSAWDVHRQNIQAYDQDRSIEDNLDLNLELDLEELDIDSKEKFSDESDVFEEVNETADKFNNDRKNSESSYDD